MKLLVSAAALAIGLAGAGTLAAQTTGGDGKPGPRQMGMIKAMDADADGKVSKAEFLAFQPKGRPALADDVKVTREGHTVGGTSIMGLMMLAAGQGHSILIEVSGVEAKAALDALIALVENGFGEED